MENRTRLFLANRTAPNCARINEATQILADKHDGAHALQVLSGTVFQLIAERQADLVTDFRHSSDLIMKAHKDRDLLPPFGPLGWTRYAPVLALGGVAGLVGC